MPAGLCGLSPVAFFHLGQTSYKQTCHKITHTLPVSLPSGTPALLMFFLFDRPAISMHFSPSCLTWLESCVIFFSSSTMVFKVVVAELSVFLSCVLWFSFLFFKAEMATSFFAFRAAIYPHSISQMFVFMWVSLASSKVIDILHVPKHG